MSNPQGLSRRNLLIGSAAYLANLKTANASQGQNIFDALSRYEFTVQDGKPVNIKALRTALKDDYVTTTFGFKDCDKFCPMVDACLSHIGQISKVKLTSIVISVQPEVDGVNAGARNAFMKKLKDGYKIRQDIVILYPSEKGTPSKEAAHKMPQLATELGAIVDMEEPVRHSAEVLLYGPGGNFITKKNGMASPGQFDNWGQYLSQVNKR